MSFSDFIAKHNQDKIEVSCVGVKCDTKVVTFGCNVKIDGPRVEIYVANIRRFIITRQEDILCYKKVG